MYFIKTPFWLKALYRKYQWHVPVADKTLFLTFDDGPHPIATPFVLNELKIYNAQATFFCIGKNVLQQPTIYNEILENGHAVGNHTHNHVNGWKTGLTAYIENVNKASHVIHSKLFRPPYGRVTWHQGRQLMQKGYRIIMWDILSGDFDTKIHPTKCLSNVIKKTIPGSIIVFHDSEKAFTNLQYTLPKMLEYFAGKGYSFKNLKEN